MQHWNKYILGALAGMGLASAAHAYGPPPTTTSPAILNIPSLPSVYKQCATDGAICNPPANAATVTVLYGDGTKYAVAQGTGSFTCLPKGWVKNSSPTTPQDLGVDDPLPGTPKKCFIAYTVAPTTGATTTPAKPAATTTVAAQPTATTPATTATASTATVPGCNAYKGTIYSATAKSYSTMAQLNGNYLKNATMDVANPTDAATSCAKQCAATGEPAPCAWFSVTKWLSTNTANGKDSTVYLCHIFNDRNLKQITTPSLPKGDNLGTASAPARFQDAQSYACRI